MTVTEALQFADQLVFAQTGKHLDDIQEAVIKGVWQGETYEKIGEQCNRSESRVRDVGYKLWQILSESLGEDIDKFNFRWTMERLQMPIISPHIVNSKKFDIVGISNHCNLYTENSKNTHNSSANTEPLSKPLHQYLTTAPKIINFYGRNKELETLSKWLNNQNTRLIAVLGLSGIGKTTLVKHFIDINAKQFDAIFWRSLKFPQSLNSLLTGILKNLCTDNTPTNTNEQLTQLLEIFQQKRCLLILDDVQNLFITRQFAGQYQSEYTDYQTFFKTITTSEHQSNLILISQEKCQEMTSLDGEMYPIQALELKGLDEAAREILKRKELKDEENWSKLIELYQGNPLYLDNISTLIKDLFNGKVKDFMAENTLLLTEDLKTVLNSLFLRLSETERTIVLTAKESFSRDTLRQSLSLSSTDLVNGLQSLDRRGLLEKVEGEKSLFTLASLFGEYVRITLCDY